MTINLGYFSRALAGAVRDHAGVRDCAVPMAAISRRSVSSS